MIPAFNPFVPNAPFLYPLKTSENRKVFLCFQGVEKGCIGNKWVNKIIFGYKRPSLLRKTSDSANVNVLGVSIAIYGIECLFIIENNFDNY